MSETEARRTALIGVGPHSRTLKFLNNKNNIATTILNKKIAMIERQNTITLNQLEHTKLDAQDFLKKVKFLEGDTKEAKALIKKGKDNEDEKNQENKTRPRRQKKIRLAQTAPANIHFQKSREEQPASAARKQVKSGPETQEEKEHMLKVDRRKSMYFQLSGKGKEASNRDTANKEEPRPPLPKPNPKTLLDVMIGLNAFSHVPPPGSRHGNETYEDIRTESRESTLGRNSIYGSSENIAQKFISQWRKNVASRKDSICMKLESFDNQFTENALQRSVSVAFSTVPEDYDSDDNFAKRKQSKMSRRSKMITPSLPAIHDEDERKEIFYAWMKDEKDRLKDDKMVYQTPELEKLAKRRNSFLAWLNARNEKNKARPDSGDREYNLSGGSGLRNILEEEDDDDYGPPKTGDLMRAILKIKTKFRDPLDSRVRKFNEEIEKIKERDAALRNKPTTKEQRRKWIMLSKGIDAALAESSDEDDDYYW